MNDSFMIINILQFFIFIIIIIYLSYKDIIERIIPDNCIIILLVLKLVIIAVSGHFFRSVLFMILSSATVMLPLLLLSLITDKLLKKETLGGGDLKLSFICSLYLGWELTYEALFIACFIALLAAGIYFMIRKKRIEAFPFAPAICVGVVIIILFNILLYK